MYNIYYEYINYYIYNKLTFMSVYNPFVQFLNEQFEKYPSWSSFSLPLASLNWTHPGTTINTIYEIIVMRIDNNVPFGIESLGS